MGWKREGMYQQRLHQERGARRWKRIIDHPRQKEARTVYGGAERGLKEAAAENLLQLCWYYVAEG